MHSSATFMTQQREHFTAEANTQLTFDVSMLDRSDNYEPLQHIAQTNERSGKQSCRVLVADRAAILAPCLTLVLLVLSELQLESGFLM